MAPILPLRSAQLAAALLLLPSVLYAQGSDRTGSGRGDLREIPRPTLTAVLTTEPIRMDGRLDEVVWRMTPSTGDFVQAEPREGEPASEQTEVWVAYDEENLYVAARLHDSDPAGLVVNDIRKDFDDQSQDVFSVILDTFADHRNGFVFMTNPEGARGDRQVANEGREINTSWDAIWSVETLRTDPGPTISCASPWPESCSGSPQESRAGISG
ncbi:MAG: carbohydrate binding family 9 domain-containing protein [Longimicrobiales bacterium]|nr:carbohydrate binding family 9 domain-containing protein [Longimicrobiales bacterium]